MVPEEVELRILSVEKVLTAEEDAALTALAMPERMFVLSSAMGRNGEGTKAFEGFDGNLSEAAIALRAQIFQRVSAMDEARRAEWNALLETCFEWATIEIGDEALACPIFEVETDAKHIRRYALSFDGENYAFVRVEYSSEEIQALQEALNGQGYDCGPADGIYGPRLRDALRGFQRDHALYEAGVITFETLQALKPANP